MRESSGAWRPFTNTIVGQSAPKVTSVSTASRTSPVTSRSVRKPASAIRVTGV
jgi:hypothetical protein